jgi:hypothetical protein
MPDWRNPEDYAYCENLTLYGWAWEFLRRNPDYVSAWEAYIAAEAAMPAAAAIDRVAAVRARDLAWANACNPFGLITPVDPSIAASDVRTLQWRSHGGVQVVEEWHWPIYEHWPGYPRNLALCFTFDRPLGPQIDDAIEKLRGCERHLREHDLWDAPELSGRARPDKYPLYVRLLDAKKTGENIYQMAKYFGKTWSACQQAIRAAEKMCKEGYRDLPLKSDAAPKKKR